MPLTASEPHVSIWNCLRVPKHDHSKGKKPHLDVELHGRVEDCICLSMYAEFLYVCTLMTWLNVAKQGPRLHRCVWVGEKTR